MRASFVLFLLLVLKCTIALRSTPTKLIAGIGGIGFFGDNIPATSAMLYKSHGVWRNTLGEIFIADTYNHRIRKVSSNGIISTFVGSGAGDMYGSVNFNGNNLPLTATNLELPCGVFQNTVGDIFIADTYNSVIRKVVKGATTVQVFAGIGGSRYGGADNIAATSSSVNLPHSVWGDNNGVIYIPDLGAHTIRKVDIAGIITTIVGQNGIPGYGANGLAGTSTAIYGPFAVWGDNINTLYFSELYNHVVRKITLSTGIVTLVAGVYGSVTYTGENLAGVSTPLYYPSGIFGDSANNLYITDNLRIRKLSLTTTLANTLIGNNALGIAPENITIPSTIYSINGGRGTFVDTAGLIFCDMENFRVKSIQFSTSRLITVAGIAPTAYGWNGNNLPGTSAQLYNPLSLWTDTNTNYMYIGDHYNQRVRRIYLPTNIISDVAGNGVTGFTGDNVPATSTAMYYPTSASTNTLGEVYITDCYNHRLRKVDLNGIITTQGME